MKKSVFFLLLISLLFIFTACGNTADKSKEALDHYINDWTENDFKAMYQKLSKEAQSTYDTEDFVDRYDKIYNDLEIKDVQIKTEDISKRERKKAKKDEKISIDARVSMDSLAGEINFERPIELVLQEADDEEEWKVNWDPGLIFPGLEDGGKLDIDIDEAKRGEILDRNQMPLAINATAYQIGIVPDLLENEEANISELANHISLSEDRIKEELEASWVESDYFVPLQTVSGTKDSLIDEVEHIPGVSVSEVSGRTYPSGEASGHLTGYVATITGEELEEQEDSNYKEGDIIGKRGLEQLYEDKLRGEDGAKIAVTKDNDTEEENVLAEKEAENGETIQLTIDVNIQEDIYDEFDEDSGTAASIDPKTGEVLALVNSPAFDPNDFVHGVSDSLYDTLAEDEKEPLLNRFAATFAPGSAFKPITAAIGLDNGSITHDEEIEIDGLTWSKDSWENGQVKRVSTTEKPVDLKLAFTNSDNIYFAMKAIDMGADNFIKGLKKFGFSDKLPFSYPIKTSQIANKDEDEEEENMDEMLLANTSYGQGQIEMSPLHLALAYTPFINEGDMIKPSFLDDEKTGETWKKELISKDDSKKINEYLEAVVEEGTGSKAKDDDLAISGKTGTAELKSSKDETGDENGWFVGYPTENEDILIAMLVENVEDKGGSGYTAEKVKNILKKAEDRSDRD